MAPTTTTTNPTASREHIMIYTVADFVSSSKFVAETVSVAKGVLPASEELKGICPEDVDRKLQVLCETDGSVA